MAMFQPLQMVEHEFEVTVESIRGLCLPEGMIWGEADCFVKYWFPSQRTDTEFLSPTEEGNGMSYNQAYVCYLDPSKQNIML